MDMPHRISRLLPAAALAVLLLPAQVFGADSQCARISTFDIAPRGEQLYPVVLIAIDGKQPGPADSPTFRVSPGRHTLTLAEAIDPEQFNSVQQSERDRGGKTRYKTLELDVEPGITYRLAAHFRLEQRHDIRGSGYWTPVIWKQTEEPCS